MSKNFNKAISSISEDSFKIIEKISKKITNVFSVIFSCSINFIIWFLFLAHVIKIPAEHCKIEYLVLISEILASIWFVLSVFIIFSLVLALLFYIMIFLFSVLKHFSNKTE